MASTENPQQPADTQLNKYIDEIARCNNLIVQRLSRVVDQEQVARYLSYLDQHEALAEPPELTFNTGIGSVLRKQDIERFCDARTPPLIDPLDRTLLKGPASYELRLGSRYRLGESDDPEWLTDSKKDLIIPPHGIAVVSTYEWLNIPGCLIGRWNLKVKMVYRGLVWVGSLQVDPGYQGFLFCPIYNLSNQPQTLIYKDPLFIIDFVLTTPTDRYGLWRLPGGRYSTFDFDRLDEQKIRSAPEHGFRQMRDDIAKLKDDDIAKLKNSIERFQDTVFVIIGIIIAALTIVAAFGITNTKWASDWILYVVAGVAVALSAVAIIIAKRKGKSK